VIELMGILNASPDSFSDGREETVADCVARGRALIADGADILDIGGESARGDRPAVAIEDEIARVEPVVAALAGETRISVDTYKPEVAEAAIAAGASLINDVSGLRDERLAAVCAAGGATLVIMHTAIEPKGTLLDPATYGDVVDDVMAFLHARIAVATAAGVERLILDPGPDFAKTPAQSVAVLRALPLIKSLGHPVLLACSRKDYIGAITGRPPRERGAGTLAAMGEGTDAGADIVRVHDVAAARDYLDVRAVMRGQRTLGPLEGLSPERYPDGVPPHLSLD
jgi:dihydropteroate synthase